MKYNFNAKDRLACITDWACPCEVKGLVETEADDTVIDDCATSICYLKQSHQIYFARRVQMAWLRVSD